MNADQTFPFVELWSDGCCEPNPGLGGWAVILLCRDNRRALSGRASETTNNRMELTAIIRGLEALKRSCRVQVFTDSMYAIGAGTRGETWLKRKNLKNRELVEKLVELSRLHDVSWQHVKGHCGIALNELADRFARSAMINGC